MVDGRSVQPSGTDTDAGRGRTASSPGEIPARGWRDVAAHVAREAKEDRLVLLAAGVAFFALLAIVPMLVAVVSIYGLVVSPGRVQRHVSDLLETMPGDARRLLTSQLRDITRSSPTGLGVTAVLGIAAALWSASSGMKHLVDAIAVAYDERPRRTMVRARGLSLLLALGAIAFVGVSFAATAVLPAAVASTGLGGGARVVVGALRWPFLALGMLAGLAVLYRVAADRDDSRWRWVSWGAAFATVSWLVASALLALYTANFAHYNRTYGSLGAVIVLMLWLFATTLVILLGAELNAELEHQTALDTTTGSEPMRGPPGVAPPPESGGQVGAVPVSSAASSVTPE